MTQPENDRDGARLHGDDPSRDRPGPAIAAALPGAILVLVAALVAVDVAGDARAGSPPGHLALEVAIIAAALAGAGVLWLQLVRTRRRAAALRVNLDAAEESLVRFRQESQELLRGLGAAIDRQFGRWELSPAEREVALLLLKGLSLKEIAGVRETSERTVRQQSLAVYRKSGLKGRAELSAFFLEDLLLPVAPPGGDERASG